MTNFEVAVPNSIALSVSISIIFIAVALLVWLILTIVFGIALMKKLNQFTKNMSGFVDTLNEKTKLVGDNTANLIRSYSLPEKKENEKTSSIGKFIMVFGSMLPIALELLQLVKKFKGGKE